MDVKKSLKLVSKTLENISNNFDEKTEIYLFICQNIDQFFEISDKIVREVKKIRDKYPDNWREMVAMTMFSTL